MDAYQRYIHLSRYARYRDDLGRRETWGETVKRYCDFFQDKFGDIFPYDRVYQAIAKLEVMPSMRALMTAGPALARDNMAGFNCSYVPVSNPRDFDEIMYILLCGTGVGFSVERQYVNQLPEIPDELHETDTTIIVADSKIGWATGFRELLSLLYAGKVPKWDLSKIRPKGARLKTFGGRASGPEPLDDLFRYTVTAFRKAVGRRFNSIEVHDLVCKIADVVVVGGVRRSALLSLSNLTDERMRGAKSGQWWEGYGHRALANNSVAYTEKPDVGIFMREWEALYESKSGERGIFNRVSAKATCKSTGRRDDSFEFGTNPCGEIILRPHGLCNLSEVVVRPEDSFRDLRRKAEIASIIGTFQSTLTDFRYVRNVWKKNADEERLLGVSLTGIMDNHLLNKKNPAWDEPVDFDDFSKGTNLEFFLKGLKDHVIETNKIWAERLGITPSVACTTVKPSGTVSQLVNSSSGIHPRYSPFYIRRVRSDIKDPLAIFMKGQGFPYEPDVTKPNDTVIFSFPVRSGDGGVFRNDLSALEQLDHYLLFKRHWCEHNPSITVYVGDDEWLDVQAWVFRNFNEVGGVSFLPRDNGSYRQAPYEEVTEEKYNELLEKMPLIVDWTSMKEEDDATTSSQEYACLGGSCEVSF